MCLAKGQNRMPPVGIFNIKLARKSNDQKLCPPPHFMENYVNIPMPRPLP